MRSILEGVTLGSTCGAEVHISTVVEGDCCLEQEVHVATGCALYKCMLLIGLKHRKRTQMLSTVLDWLKAQKKTDLKALLAEHASSEEGQLILQNQQNFTIHQGALYLHSMLKG